MHEIHRTASEKIFQSRNSHLEASLIDLHGLHADEGWYYLIDRLESLKKKGYSGKVYVIIGSGKHSRDDKARVLPSITKWLQEDPGNWSFKEGSLSDGRGGCLIINM